MARTAKTQRVAATTPAWKLEPARPPLGSVRTCMPYRDEMARHRVMTADGHDFAVATTRNPHGGWIVGAYPVQYGYLVLIRQALCELHVPTEEAARERHEALVRVLAEAGVRVVRARRSLAARRRAEMHVDGTDAAAQWRATETTIAGDIGEWLPSPAELAVTASV